MNDSSMATAGGWTAIVWRRDRHERRAVNLFVLERGFTVGRRSDSVSQAASPPRVNPIPGFLGGAGERPWVRGGVEGEAVAIRKSASE